MGVSPPIPVGLYMGRAARGGPAHKTALRPRRTRHDTGRRASQDCMKISGDLGDLLGYTKSRNSCNFLSCKTDQDRNNRSVTLPPGYIRWVGTPLKIISYTIQYTKDIGCSVLRRSDGPNLSKSLSLCLCHHAVPITLTSTDSSTTMGIPLGRLPTIFRR